MNLATECVSLAFSWGVGGGGYTSVNSYTDNSILSGMVWLVLNSHFLASAGILKNLWGLGTEQE